MFVAIYLALAILKHLYIVIKWHHLVLCHVHKCMFESANCIIFYTNCTLLMEGAFEMWFGNWTLWESFVLIEPTPGLGILWLASGVWIYGEHGSEFFMILLGWLHC